MSALSAEEVSVNTKVCAGSNVSGGEFLFRSHGCLLVSPLEDSVLSTHSHLSSSLAGPPFPDVTPFVGHWSRRPCVFQAARADEMMPTPESQCKHSDSKSNNHMGSMQPSSTTFQEPPNAFWSALSAAPPALWSWSLWSVSHHFHSHHPLSLNEVSQADAMKENNLLLPQPIFVHILCYSEVFPAHHCLQSRGETWFCFMVQCSINRALQPHTLFL